VYFIYSVVFPLQYADKESPAVLLNLDSVSKVLRMRNRAVNKYVIKNTKPSMELNTEMTSSVYFTL